ncbi:uncharacterized protein LAESUDRAFT_760029 [Laetiporus sulphureus 93-53]|uniref:Uncharacterized protein n=1 Tax=Laetiporus sulphureus 93-53 TaxID=1314785 RepID=A0A165DX26_9APHY|nr:uncharacterized protein LAESUDRAFT_760029 [Laetiporus sulphureus 93-53]KZT05804.1 hypothetical protein LAESUDRAFT_760029 [Laetiporus sulphureus 93-53]
MSSLDARLAPGANFFKLTTDDDEDIESAIWRINTSTSTIMAHWVILLLTGDDAVFARAYMTTPVVKLIWEIASHHMGNTLE